MAQRYVAARKEIAFTKEGTRGSGETVQSGQWFPHEGYDFKDIAEKIDRTSATGDINQLKESKVSKEYAQGAVPMKMSVEFAGILANMVMGQAPSTSGSGTYTHAWTSRANNNAHVSYTVTRKDPIAGVFKHALGMLNTLAMDITPDDYINLALDMWAKKGSVVSASSSYSTTDTFFLPKQVSIKFADTYAGLGAASATPMSNITLNVAKNLSYDFVVGSTEPADIVNGRMALNGSFTLPYTDTTFRDLGLGDGTKAMAIIVSDGTNSMEIELPTVNFREPDEDDDNDAYMLNTVVFNATSEDATNGLVKMEVVNGVSSY